MTDEKWEQLVEHVTEEFSESEVRKEDADEEVDEDGVTSNVLIFKAPHGKFKLVRENRPVVLEKKMHYSHRPGDTARTEYKISDTEFSHKLFLYKQMDGEWQEVSLDNLGL